MITVAASFTITPFATWLRWWVKDVLGLSDISIEEAPFNTLLQLLLGGGGRRSILVALVRFEDLWTGNDGASELSMERNMATLIDGIHAYITRGSRRLVLLLCHPLEQRPEYLKAVSALRALEQETRQLTVLTPDAVGAWYPVDTVHDAIAYEIGRVPFTDECFAGMAGAIARSALPSLQAPLKIVVCDCDYTLWHGAVGEVGAMDVLFHRRHLQLHRRLVALLQRGVYICLCSRNTPEDVWDVMAREESVLRREHISAHRISPMLRKSEAVASLAASFEASLDTVLFIDDNATEIADVRTALPEVPCWLFPCSPIHENSMALAEMDHVWRLDITGQPTSTAADASRTSASAIAARQHVRAALFAAQHEGSASPPASSADGVPSPLAAFHADLRTQISFLGARDERERFLQLAERTNQFNAWKRPGDAAQLLEGADGGFAVHVSDRDTEHGVVGSALWTLVPGEKGILTCTAFMMSCRVLGRGVEYAMLARLGGAAREAGAPRVRVGACPAARNQPVLRFLSRVQSAASNGACGGARAAQGGEGPDRWFEFASEALASLTFDPDAAAAAEASETAEEREVPVAGAIAAVHPIAANVAAALTRIPTQLCSVADMLRERLMVVPHGPEGSGDSSRAHRGPNVAESEPRDNAEGATEAKCLRTLVRRVLCTAVEVDDATPLGALGLDSTTAVRLISLAAQDGLELPRDVWRFEQLIRATAVPALRG